ISDGFGVCVRIDQRFVSLQHVFARRVTSAQKKLLHALVTRIVNEYAVGGVTIATRSAGFLVISFERSGYLIVQYEPDVSFVDAEAECICRNHDARAVAHEIVLDRRTLFRAEAAVVSA